MKYIPSVNIEQGITDDFQYVVTSNAQSVLGQIISCFNDGFHSFTIVGTYGTGKSSFLAALERDLNNNTNVLVSNKNVFPVQEFEFMNIVGDYATLSSQIALKLNLPKYSTSDEVLHTFNDYCNSLKKRNTFLFVVVDEFGKCLEHAAATNPEQELYFLQKLAEYINSPLRNIILLSTLHQNFSTYAYKLNEAQRNEWTKVKGRFKEIVFAEPIEQLLELTANQLEQKTFDIGDDAKKNFRTIYRLAREYKIINFDIALSTTLKLYPLDPISAVCLTHAIQRYGQNERTLFSFINSTDRYSLHNFRVKDNRNYNIADVYDYIVYNFYTYLSEVNADSMEWRAMRMTIDRIENSSIEQGWLDNCLSIVKTIGLLGLFCKNIKIDNNLLTTYSKNALGIANVDEYIEKLKSLKIIRYATYKEQYILFEGTDIDIEDELYKASNRIAKPNVTIDNIEPYLHQKAVMAQASYYKTGTPRYFEYRISNTPISIVPQGDTDGYINLVFPLGEVLDDVIQISHSHHNAIIYAYFKNTDDIIKHLHEIKKLRYIIEYIAIDDRVAQTELRNLLQYEEKQLNAIVNDNLFNSDNVVWIFNAKEVKINSQRELNKQLSSICDIVYSETPILRNELFNREKVNSVISQARVNLLDAILNNSEKEDLGFDVDSFPPEKTIYYSLLKETGMHKESGNSYVLSEPTNNIQQLWKSCCDFIDNSKEKPRKISELINILKQPPFKLKQGVIDFWLPIFIYIKQQDFALYEDNKFVLSVNKEVFDLLQKRPQDFSLKSYDVSGVQQQFFHIYRLFFSKNDSISITKNSLIEIAKPFFRYYNSLNDYAKHTCKFDSPFTAKFRDILANASDPSKTFFEDLPRAFGYSDLNRDEFIEQYISLIKRAIQELNNCFNNFIIRIENSVVEHLGLPQDYNEYKIILVKKYGTINKNLLTPKTKSFLDRLLAPSASKNEFYSKIGLVIFDKKIENIKDSEEELFIKNILHLFSELEHFTSLSAANILQGDEAYNIEFATSSGRFVPNKTFRLPLSKQKEAQKIAGKIQSLLSGNEEEDICILLKLLNEKIQ